MLSKIENQRYEALRLKLLQDAMDASGADPKTAEKLLRELKRRSANIALTDQAIKAAGYTHASAILTPGEFSVGRNSLPTQYQVKM